MSEFTLHLGDAVEYMRTLPDGCFDAVVTDFPYGVEIEYNTYRDTRENLIALIGDAVPEMLRLAPVVAVFTGVANIHLYPPSTWTLAWHWKNTSSTGYWGFNNWQPVLVYGSDPMLKNGLGRKQDAMGFPPYTNVNEGGGHPCPKPTPVMNWIVSRCSLPGDTVFDPFMGSGTTGVAAIQTGRRFVGCEIDPEYFKIAERRIRETQPPLFVAEAAPRAEQLRMGETP